MNLIDKKTIKSPTEAVIDNGSTSSSGIHKFG